MDKSMLKDGYKVLFRNGEIGYALPSASILVCVMIHNMSDVYSLNDYFIDLLHCKHTGLDITEIYDNSGNLVCKRKEEYEPSEQEITLFKLIDKKWKWIAVDKDGVASVSDIKQKRMENSNCFTVHAGNMSYIEAFLNVIKITWNDEPVELDKWR